MIYIYTHEHTSNTSTHEHTSIIAHDTYHIHVNICTLHVYNEFTHTRTHLWQLILYMYYDTNSCMQKVAYFIYIIHIHTHAHTFMTANHTYIHIRVHVLWHELLYAKRPCRVCCATCVDSGMSHVWMSHVWMSHVWMSHVWMSHVWMSHAWMSHVW